MRKDEATLNLPNEIVVSLPATHRDLVKFFGTNDPSYLTVREILASIDCRPRAIVGLPTTPPFQEVGYRINFKGYIRVFGKGVLEIERSFSVSDLQEESPRKLLNLPAFPTATEGTDGVQLPQLLWVHIPLTNTAWVNVGASHSRLSISPTSSHSHLLTRRVS